MEAMRRSARGSSVRKFVAYTATAALGPEYSGSARARNLIINTLFRTHVQLKYAWLEADPRANTLVALHSSGFGVFSEMAGQRDPFAMCISSPSTGRREFP
jgi:hypothetical protein